MGTISDFDFFIGDWRVAHRRLNQRLANCSAWEEFGGVCSTRKILGGQGNMDDNLIHLPAGDYRAITLRAFDPSAQQWAIWWLDARDPHALDTPMRGGFENGRGVFFADETFNDQPIRVRFLWSSGDSPRWAQAFSPDGGASWETNWIMDFTRITQAEV